MKTTQLNKLKNLQAGKELAKVSFDANCLRELTILHDSKTIVVSHPDIYNFSVNINGHTTYYGRLSGALIKAYNFFNKNKLSIRFETFIKDNGYKDITPEMPCKLIDIKNIRKEILNES